MDLDDEDGVSTSFKTGSPKMNGHSTPKMHYIRKKSRQGDETHHAGASYKELQEQRKRLPIFLGGHLCSHLVLSH
jgi:hypothetical protein